MLSDRSYDIVGFDTDYYRGTDLYSVERSYRKITRDIRSVSPEDVQGVEAVVHLAGLSNDPLGALAPNLTEDINLRGTLQLARLARNAGVKRFVYASSQSMYGISNTDDELDEDDSNKTPLLLTQEPNGTPNCNSRNWRTKISPSYASGLQLFLGPAPDFVATSFSIIWSPVLTPLAK